MKKVPARTFIIKGLIAKGTIAPLVIWEHFKAIAEKQGFLRSQYNLDVDMMKNGRTDLGKTLLLDAENVAQAIKDDLGKPGLSVRDFESVHIQPRHRISFFEKGYLAFSTSELTFPFDDFLVCLSASCKLVNCTLVDSDYLNLSMTEFLDKGDRDVLKYPAWGMERNGYYEGVSAEMWLGEAFWQYAACSKEDVLNADWLNVEDRGSHLHVIAWPEPFTSSEGEQGEIQRCLLKLLFDIK